MTNEHTHLAEAYAAAYVSRYAPGPAHRTVDMLTAPARALVTVHARRDADSTQE